MPRKTTTTANKTSENMKTKRKSEKLCFTVCDVILCFLMVFVSLKDVVDAGMSNDSQKILSRRRRYLTFPEGSSFQVGMYFYLCYLCAIIDSKWLAGLFRRKEKIYGTNKSIIFVSMTAYRNNAFHLN